MRRVLVFVSLAALVVPASAFAHASITQSFPAYRERLAQSPRDVTLRFDQSVTALPNSIVVLTPDGKNVAAPARAIPAKNAIVARLPKLPRGPYTVRWQAMSNDGHVVSGVFTFGVRVRAPLVTDAVGAQGPTRTEDLVRWIYFLGLALVVGGAGFRLIVVRGALPPRAERRFYWVTGIGVVVLLEAGIVAFLLRAEDALQLPFGRFLYGDLSPISGGTRFGTAFIVMELGFAFVSALLFLASGLSLSGHSAADAGHSWLSELADWVHLSAATLWIGGLVQLAAVIWPAAPDLRRVAFLRFSRLATVLIALLLVAGTYLSILRLPHVHDLWTTGYGHVLLVKLSLVALALAWGAVHHFLAVPKIERPGVVGRLSRSLVGESAVAMAVLLLAAVLVDSRPPARTPAKAPVAVQPAAAERGADR
jgi:copper transport protein